MEVFNTKKKNLSNCNKSAPYINHCDHLIRLTESLKFYANLDVENNPSDGDKLVDFVENIYNDNISKKKIFLNDYIHLVTEHAQNLEYINSELLKRNDFPKCSLQNCVLTCRHHKGVQSDEKINDSEEDKVFDNQSLRGFYVDSMDGLHYYLFHLFDIGLRVNKQKLGDDEKEDDIFVGLTKMISEKQKQYGNKFNRFQSSKFNIAIKDNEDQQTFTETLWTEEIFEEFSRNKITENDKKKLYSFLNECEYDSDAIQTDVYDYIMNGSNIEDYMRSCEVVTIINKYIEDTKLSSKSFSVGLRFYYWSYYKDVENEEYMGWEWNIFDHGGYKVNKLFIEHKFNTFKEEIFEYEYINIKEYNELVFFKANEYFYSNEAKNTKANVSFFGSDPVYDIEHESPLNVKHLMSVILYTDFSELSTDFSSTFRKVDSSESLSSLKCRNQRYWWLSKTLRETVECYGLKRGEYGCWNNSQYCGPFYCGMSFLMIVPQFNIRLCSPTSTSIHMEVAARFSGADGILITFNNDGAEYPAHYLRFLDCSWISKFKEEDERLIFGGRYTIGIENITVVTAMKSYRKLFRALIDFDSLLVGTGLSYKYQDKSTVKDTKFMSSLINNELGITTDITLDKYIVDTFHLYCNNKTTIRIDFEYLNSKTTTDEISTMPILICHSIKRERHNFDINNIKDASRKNMLKYVVFKLFKHLSTLVVVCGNKRYAYPFSVKSLLKTWHTVSYMDQLKLEAMRSLDNKEDGWLYKMGSSSKFQSYIQNEPYGIVRKISTQSV